MSQNSIENKELSAIQSQRKESWGLFSSFSLISAYISSGWVFQPTWKHKTHHPITLL